MRWALWVTSWPFAAAFPHMPDDLWKRVYPPDAASTPDVPAPQEQPDVCSKCGDTGFYEVDEGMTVICDCPAAPPLFRYPPGTGNSPVSLCDSAGAPQEDGEPRVSACCLQWLTLTAAKAPGAEHVLYASADDCRAILALLRPVQTDAVQGIVKVLLALAAQHEQDARRMQDRADEAVFEEKYRLESMASVARMNADALRNVLAPFTADAVQAGKETP